MPNWYLPPSCWFCCWNWETWAEVRTRAWLRGGNRGPEGFPDCTWECQPQPQAPPTPRWQLWGHWSLQSREGSRLEDTDETWRGGKGTGGSGSAGNLGHGAAAGVISVISSSQAECLGESRAPQHPPGRPMGEGKQKLDGLLPLLPGVHSARCAPSGLGWVQPRAKPTAPEGQTCLSSWGGRMSGAVWGSHLGPPALGGGSAAGPLGWPERGVHSSFRILLFTQSIVCS